MTECTGIAASWCPVHGDCTCPRNEDGEILTDYFPGLVSLGGGLSGWSETARSVDRHDDRCPLHGGASAHAGVVG